MAEWLTVSNLIFFVAVTMVLFVLGSIAKRASRANDLPAGAVRTPAAPPGGEPTAPVTFPSAAASALAVKLSELHPSGVLSEALARALFREWEAEQAPKMAATIVQGARAQLVRLEDGPKS